MLPFRMGDTAGVAGGGGLPIADPKGVAAGGRFQACAMVAGHG